MQKHSSPVSLEKLALTEFRPYREGIEPLSLGRTTSIPHFGTLAPRQDATILLVSHPLYTDCFRLEGQLFPERRLRPPAPAPEEQLQELANVVQLQKRPVHSRILETGSLDDLYARVGDSITLETARQKPDWTVILTVPVRIDVCVSGAKVFAAGLQMTRNIYWAPTDQMGRLLTEDAAIESAVGAARRVIVTGSYLGVCLLNSAQQLCRSAKQVHLLEDSFVCRDHDNSRPIIPEDAELRAHCSELLKDIDRLGDHQYQERLLTLREFLSAQQNRKVVSQQRLTFLSSMRASGVTAKELR